MKSYPQFNQRAIKMSAYTTKIFIPRILGGINISSIRTAFADHKIGKLVNINLHKKKNDKNHVYSFAFIEIELFETDEANCFKQELDRAGVIDFHYNHKNYWEVKRYLSRKSRATKLETAITTTSTIPMVNGVENINQGESKLIPMFYNNHAEEDDELRNIEELCHSFIVPPQQADASESLFMRLFPSYSRRGPADIFGIGPDWNANERKMTKLHHYAMNCRDRNYTAVTDQLLRC